MVVLRLGLLYDYSEMLNTPILSAEPLHHLCLTYIFFLVAQQPYSGIGRLTVEVSRSDSDTSHSVGFLWTRDRPVAESSTGQHTTFTTDIHAPCGIRTRNRRSRWPRGVRRRSAAARLLGLTYVAGLNFLTYACFLHDDD
jgi:hypothetical protein